MGSTVSHETSDLQTVEEETKLVPLPAPFPAPLPSPLPTHFTRRTRPSPGLGKRRAEGLRSSDSFFFLDTIPAAGVRKRKRATTRTTKPPKTAASSASRASSTSSIIDNMPLANNNFEDLKAWIAEQETQPTPLTAKQQKALAELRAAIVREIPEPAVPLDKDWVSIAYQYQQSKKPEGCDFTFTYETAPSGPGPETKWVAYLHFMNTLYGRAERFPCQDAGFVVVNARGTLGAPPFAKKKDARRYAAKCLVDHLVREGLMDADGNPTTTTPKKSKKAKAQPQPKPKVIVESDNDSDDSDDEEDDESSTSSPGPGPGTDAAAAGVSVDATIKDEEGEPTAAQRVEKLCRKLGFVVPRYKLEQKGASGCFDGSVDFGPDAFSFPDDIGRVEGVYTKVAAKEKLAEMVLVKLLEEDARRKKIREESG